ncbi:MAG: UDP-N-acetylmuramoyl-tripeptide--D-alanyl-D-alanine ligase [Clostridia bacterium]
MYTLKEIAKITEGKILKGDAQTSITEFSIRRKEHCKGAFYIPIFCNEDRQQYIIDAVKAGATGYMISNKYDRKEDIIEESLDINPEIMILEVENINQAIYQMASMSREQNKTIPIIAVTGSVGKTSICAMLTSILKQEKVVLSDEGNNHNTKVLLSHLLLDIQNYEIAVLEAGIASKNAMEPIAKLLEPSIAVINNIGTAHIGNLGSRENILKEKLQLTKYMQGEKIVFLNEEDDLLRKVKLDKDNKVYKYSLKEASHIQQQEDKIVFRTKVYDKETTFTLQAYGEHSVSNAICAIRIAEHFNIQKENIQKGLQGYRNVHRRFEVINQKGYTMIDDTYNASLASMEAGIKSANLIKKCKRRIAILGDMLELGEYAKELHTRVSEIFETVDFDMILTQGEKAKYITEAAKAYMPGKVVKHFDTQEALIDFLLSQVKEGDLLYFKASKKMGFDKIVKKLLEQERN